MVASYIKCPVLKIMARSAVIAINSRNQEPEKLRTTKRGTSYLLPPITEEVYMKMLWAHVKLQRPRQILRIDTDGADRKETSLRAVEVNFLTLGVQNHSGGRVAGYALTGLCAPTTVCLEAVG